MKKIVVQRFKPCKNKCLRYNSYLYSNCITLFMIEEVLWHYTLHINIKKLQKFYSSATQFTFRPGNFEKSAAENLQFDQCTSDALTRVQEHTDKHNATTKSTVTCTAIKENIPKDACSNSTENTEVR